jgi:hypothetical protein
MPTAIAARATTHVATLRLLSLPIRNVMFPLIDPSETQEPLDSCA